MTDYRIVPVEPTPEMVEAAEDAYMPFGDMELAIRMAALAAPAVQGEPVAKVRTVGGYPDESEHTVHWLCKYKDLKDGDLLYATPQPAEQQPALAKYQPCGCVVCTCEHETRCQGCGAHHCGTHPVGQIPGPVYQQTAQDVAELQAELERERKRRFDGNEQASREHREDMKSLVEALEAVVFYHEEVEDNDGNLMMHYSKMMRKVREALAAYRKQGGDV